MSRFRPDPDHSRSLPPDRPRDRSQDAWHCERCKTSAQGRSCPRCPTCGELMFAGELMTPELIAKMRRQR